MKNVKSTKRHSASRQRKPARPARGLFNREESSSRPNNRLRRREAGKPVSHVMTKAGHKGIAASTPEARQASTPHQTALKNFETGVRTFQRRDYDRAAEIFEKLVDIDARDIAERAQMHLRLCRQRTSRAPSIPRSAEEYYALGVACLNSRDLAQATEHLQKSDKLKPNQDHVQYALAVAHALGGNSDLAFTHLEAAFALRPENRIHARRDEDLVGLASDPRFRRLMFPSSS